MKNGFIHLLASRGYRIVQGPADMEDEFRRFYDRCRNATMVSLESMYAIYQATRYIAHNNISGSIVQCGVWKGGSAMLCAYTLTANGADDRPLWLYDTFSGMTEPGALDLHGRDLKPARTTWEAHRADDRNRWAYAPLEEVKANIHGTGYAGDLVHYVVGQVEETIPAQAPDDIALLHLDTDWHDSTRHELAHLFPRLSVGGVLIIDDYGGWLGARKAVDDYFAHQGLHPFLDRIDWSARLLIKQEHDRPRPDQDA